MQIQKKFVIHIMHKMKIFPLGHSYSTIKNKLKQLKKKKKKGGGGGRSGWEGREQSDNSI